MNAEVCNEITASLNRFEYNIAVTFKGIADVSCNRFLQRLQNILMLISFKHSLLHNYFKF